MKNLFFSILLAPLIFIGCSKEQSGSTTTRPGGTPTLDVPMPTAEILAALGPENNVSLQHLLPNPFLVVCGKPKQFLASPLGVGNEWISSMLLDRSLQLIGIDPSNIEFFVQSIGLSEAVPILVPQQDPNMPPLQRMYPIARRSTVITFGAPVNLPTLLAATLEPGEDPDTRKRTEGKTEYYDLTPSTLNVPQQRLALGLVNDRTVVLAEGIEDDIAAIFSDTVPKGAALDRLKHTPIDNSELVIITSLEGLPVSPAEWDSLMEQNEETEGILQNFMPLIHRHLRAMSLSLSVSAGDGQSIVTVFVEGRDTKGAEAIGESIQGFIIGLQTMLATMNEDAKNALPIPADFAVSLLGAMSVNVEGTRVHVALNNFEMLIPTIAEGIHRNQIIMQRVELQHRQLDALKRGLWGLFLRYYDENGKFPADITDADGKPLLSWRVALLPQMGMGELYTKFKLDEPWDSVVNKELMNSMPVFFLSMPGEAAPTKTVFRLFDSAGTPFSNPNLKAEEIRDPFNTLMFVIVHPRHAVEWTKPEPLEFNIDTLSDIVGDSLLGITFSGQKVMLPVPPKTHPQYEEWKRRVEILIKGTP